MLKARLPHHAKSLPLPHFENYEINKKVLIARTNPDAPNMNVCKAQSLQIKIVLIAQYYYCMNNTLIDQAVFLQLQYAK